MYEYFSSISSSECYDSLEMGNAEAERSDRATELRNGSQIWERPTRGKDSIAALHPVGAGTRGICCVCRVNYEMTYSNDYSKCITLNSNEWEERGRVPEASLPPYLKSQACRPSFFPYRSLTSILKQIRLGKCIVSLT